MKQFIITHAKPVYYTGLTVIAGVGTAVSTALGGWDQALKFLCVTMAIDYLTGIACALIWKKSSKSDDGAFESKASIKGLFRKGLMLVFVWIGAELDLLTGSGFIRNGIIIFFIGNDGLSIIENAGLMGLPLPSFIKSAFEVLRKKGEDTSTPA